MKEVQRDARQVRAELMQLLKDGLSNLHDTWDEMAKVTEPISEITDSMEAAQEVIDHLIKYGYK